jgi:hypothetical protein
VHPVGALGHGANWGGTGSRRWGRDVDCTKAVLERADVNDGEVVGLRRGGVCVGVGVGVIRTENLEGEAAVDEMVIACFLQIKGKDLCGWNQPYILGKERVIKRKR